MKSNRLALGVLLLLLLVLTLRLTMTESLRQTLSQVTVGGRGAGGVAVVDIGAGTTMGLGVVTILLAGMAAWIGGRARAVTWGRVGKLVVILAVMGLGVATTFFAANRFYSAVGLLDLSSGLLGGWAVSVLCQRAVLGDVGRKIVAAMLMAVLAVWCFRGMYQRFIDIPDTIAYYQQHKEEAIAQALGPTQHLQEGDPELTLLESRMMSKEVSGYVTLSNVMGAGMVGLVAVMAGVLGASWNAEWGMRNAELEESKEGEISLPALLRALGILLVVAGLVTVILTASRGGSVMAFVCVAGIGMGAWQWRWVVKHRGAVVAMVVAAAILGGAAVVGYGLAKDRLPSKSLMFRWHYWTAAAKLVEAHPGLGVGLNNFGDYYTAVKRSSSPEDVKDPHSFFVRLASEMGVPAMVLVGLLVAWMAWGAVGVRRVEEQSVGGAGMIGGIGVLFCVVWWAVHQGIAEVDDTYYLILTVLAGLVAIGGWLLASTLLGLTGGRGVRMVCVAMVIGALGMLVYDQINMALVTGPVGMLFWVMMGVGDSYDEAGREKPDIDEGASPHEGVPAAPPMASAALLGIGTLLTAMGIVAGVWWWWPTVEGRMSWDPTPWMAKYLQIVSAAGEGRSVDLAAAEGALEEALSRAPRSSELRRQLVIVRLQRHEPVAEEIRELVALDHANARPRMTLAMPETDLPVAERVKLLEEALKFDAMLPEGEVMRLRPAERAAIAAKIEELKRREGAGR